MNRFIMTCAAALLGAASSACDYEPICPADYDFDPDRSVCVFFGDAGPVAFDAGTDASTPASDAGVTDDAAIDDAAVDDAAVDDAAVDDAAIDASVIDAGAGADSGAD